ncbi:uncharacterized protein LOC101448790 [Ceratitis capitata]|uniref:uncharacterized protein LOC101448790 n=1 Tax=Ceratitis capitata TaxID=7213 RepID=UPI0006187FB2|nr:uncharacterized protein LOC101448790 [Ceratitis capitata]
MANADMDMRANLTDLSKIPVKEFEKHFRDWMERDDVARSLQAKLRTDLISNFNKTALGRQILAQTTTTITGGGTQRLTLSPLVLALNTLVAEFLYAQNCHFSLSVFCTEVPFRNTLPDFESAQHFRFSCEEIKEILEAVFNKSPQDSPFKNIISKKYENNKNISLLMVILRYLLRQKEDYAKRVAALKPGTINEGTQTVEKDAHTHEKGKFSPPSDSREPCCSKTEIPSSNIRYLNKYLMILSTKVKEMSEQLADLRHKRSNLPGTRLARSVRTRRYDKLNHSLERIMSQLKQMTHTKRKSKQVGAVVSAVDSLATQFSKCVDSFRSVSRELIASNEKRSLLQQVMPKKTELTQAAVQVDLSYRRANGVEQKKIVEERSYTDWVHEMRHTKNGQKFLDKIEVSLKKALNKQRELLRKESEEKLRHQKEVLRIQYKEKLMEQLSRLPPYDYSSEARKLNDSIGRQLQEFESRHSELLEKIQDVRKIEIKNLPSNDTEKEAANNGPADMTDEIVRRVVKEMEPKFSPSGPHCFTRQQDSPHIYTKVRDPLLKDVVNTQRQLQKMAESIVEQERTVDQIVYEARQRIQELENESNQLELNFRNYLERQRIQTETMREVVSSLSESNKKEMPKVADTYRRTMRDIRSASPPLSAESVNESAKKVKTRHKTVKLKDSSPELTDQENKNPNFEYRNAILEAKTKLFKNYRSRQEETERADEEPYYYNQNFGSCESQSNMLASADHSRSTNLPANINYANDLNTTSARSNGAPLGRCYTILPNTPQPSLTKPTTSAAAETLKALLSRTESPFLDTAMPTVIAQKTTVSTVAISAAASGAQIGNEEGLPSVGFSRLSDSETPTSSNNSGAWHNQSILVSDLSRNSCRTDKNAKKEPDADTDRRTRSVKDTTRKIPQETHRSKNTTIGGSTQTKNPAENAMLLMETMERMHRLFTEAPVNGKKEKPTQTTLKFTEKPKPIYHDRTQKQLPKSPKSKTRKSATMTREEPSTSIRSIQNKKESKEPKSKPTKTPKTPETSEEPCEQTLNTFHNTGSVIQDLTAESTAVAMRPHFYNITSSATVINGVAPTVSSTTFSVCVDDNLKEVVSESSIEIASMVEAVDEEIELEALVADAEDLEEEAEEEVDEEQEPMGGVKASAVPMPLTEEVSSSSSSAVHMLEYGGGGGGSAGRTKKSDSGSDFWE